MYQAAYQKAKKQKIEKTGDYATNIREIVRYLSLGFGIIPLKGKVPLVQWKEYQFSFKDFTKPGVNIGIRAGLLPTGHYLYFVDLDNKALLAPFYEANPNLMCAPLVSTGRGYHVYLCWREEPRTRHLAGMDIICNGYVVAPPSTHPSGKVYKFIIPLNGEPPLFNPKWLEAPNGTPSPPLLLRHQSVSRQVLSKEAERSRHDLDYGVLQGRRRTALIQYLGILFTACFREEEALEKAVEWNNKNRPLLSQEEVTNAVRTCYEEWNKYERKKLKENNRD